MKAKIRTAAGKTLQGEVVEKIRVNEAGKSRVLCEFKPRGWETTIPVYEDEILTK